MGPFNLNSEDSEYIVIYNKLFFNGCLILEFKIKNTMEDQTLLDVGVLLKFA